MKRGFTYILLCNDGSYYTGSTSDLQLRLQQHQSGEGAHYTKKRLPVTYVYVEELPTIAHAFQREKQIQGWSRSKKLALISSHWNQLHLLSECRNDSHAKYFGKDGETGV